MYPQLREAKFFKDTKFVIDRFHTSDHVGCSAAFFAQTYMNAGVDLYVDVNDSAAESGNSGISKFHRSLLFMKKENFMKFCRFQLECQNRLHILKYIEEMRKEGVNYDTLVRTIADYYQAFHDAYIRPYLHQHE